MNKYKQSNIVENYKIFLNKIEGLKLYIIKFNKKSIMKPKIYPLDYAIRNKY